MNRAVIYQKKTNYFVTRMIKTNILNPEIKINFYRISFVGGARATSF